MAWMHTLTEAQQSIVRDRFNQCPSEWPTGMASECDKIKARKGGTECSDDVIEIIAEWVALNHGETS